MDQKLGPGKHGHGTLAFSPVALSAVQPLLRYGPDRFVIALVFRQLGAGFDTELVDQI